MSKVRHYSKRISCIRSIYDTYFGRHHGWNWKWARIEEMYHYRSNNFRERCLAMGRLKNLKG